jgi:prepilin-type N-terminal cleavage/methylation domain-containing protein
LDNLRQRLSRGDGLTIFELIVVIAIIGILLAFTVTSYLGLRGRASSAVARANIHAAIPAAVAYYADYGTYSFAKLQSGTAAETALDALRSYDGGIDRDLVVRAENGGGAYCLTEVGEDGVPYFFYGPGGRISSALATSGPPGSTPTCT